MTKSYILTACPSDSLPTLCFNMYSLIMLFLSRSEGAFHFTVSVCKLSDSCLAIAACKFVTGPGAAKESEQSNQTKYTWYKDVTYYLLTQLDSAFFST